MKLSDYTAQITSMDKKEKRNLILSIVLSVVASLYVSILFSSAIVGSFALINTDYQDLTRLQLSLGTKIGRVITLCFFVALMFIVLAIITRKKLSNRIIASDDRGVHYMEDNTHGSSKWLNEKEIEEVFEVANIADTHTTIYGQLEENGTRVVGHKVPKKGGSGNQNLLILGSPGTGKSYAYVRTEIMQSILRGDSFVVTDPSLELFTDLSVVAENNGYDVKVLNLSDPKYTDTWDCMSEVIDPETERLDDTRLNSFAETYVKNADDGGKTEKFWSDSAINIFKAIIGYTSWEREEFIMDKYNKLYDKVSVGIPGSLNIKSNVINTAANTSFIKCKEIILDTAIKNNYDADEIVNVFKEIENSAPKFNFSKVFDNVIKIKELSFDSLPSWHSAKIAYTIFNTGSETVKGSALQGIQLKMSAFTDIRLKNMLSKDGIRISDINTKKCGYFIIIDLASSAPTRPIASLFFNFFFQDAQKVYNFYESLAKESGTKNPCLPVTVMLDEFFAIGVIGGNPGAFATVMSLSRKCQLHISIILQSYGQLEALYEEANSETIQTCCDTTIFLGCNDPGTAEFISSFISGEATVLNERHSESQALFAEFNSRLNGVQFTTTQRQLLTIGEAREWRNKVLIAQRGTHPMQLKPFPYTQHPFYKEGKIIRASVKTRYAGQEDIILINGNDGEKIRAEMEKLDVSNIIDNLKPLDLQEEVVNSSKANEEDKNSFEDHKMNEHPNNENKNKNLGKDLSAEKSEENLKKQEESKSVNSNNKPIVQKENEKQKENRIAGLTNSGSRSSKINKTKVILENEESNIKIVERFEKNTNYSTNKNVKNKSNTNKGKVDFVQGSLLGSELMQDSGFQE